MSKRYGITRLSLAHRRLSENEMLDRSKQWNCCRKTDPYVRSTHFKMFRIIWQKQCNPPWVSWTVEMGTMPWQKRISVEWKWSVDATQLNANICRKYNTNKSHQIKAIEYHGLCINFDSKWNIQLKWTWLG